jgi:predicted aspartyl protease
VRVNDRDLSFLLDTGSDHSAIDATVAQQLGLAETGKGEILKDYREQAAATTEAEF